MSRVGAAAALIALAVAAATCGGAEKRVVVAAGTTLVDSGVIEALALAYEMDRPEVEISVVGLATREVLELGRRGAADLLITHAPQQEREFLASQPDASARGLFSSRFLLVGPDESAAALDGLSVADALRRIAEEGLTFVTRADGSGTHDREVALWEAAGVSPDGRPWYLETGQGMGQSLQVADQREAFTLVEEGTFLGAFDVVRLRPVELVGDPAALANPYAALLPETDDEAERFVEWLVSPAGRSALERVNARIFGVAVYSP